MAISTAPTRVTVALPPGLLTVLGPSNDRPVYQLLGAALPLAGVLALLIIQAVSIEEESV